MTDSCGWSHASARPCAYVSGRSSGGIPSRLGPPEVISDSGTQCREKSVFQEPLEKPGSSLASAGDPAAERQFVARQLAPSLPLVTALAQLTVARSTATPTV